MSEPKIDRSGSRAEIPLIEAALMEVDGSKSSGSKSRSETYANVADSIPGYTVVREIRRGAQGIVFEAVQQGTNRAVAIKVIFGVAMPSRRARFEREVQILGRLKHPNIVTIHDSVISEDRAYIVMDFIDGHALDDHLKFEERTTDQLLEMFALISEAVGAAHLQGVIHRDLKPSNIRIDKSDRPRVLDFGLAKLIDETESGVDQTMVTRTGQFVGSLPWASPEQAEGSRNELDIRTDVYSIGIMMYKALTGSFPYNVTGSMREVTHAIQQIDPKKPSISGARTNDEIDMIVLKSLAKDSDRRYQSAGELARDLRRYLQGEPIEAKRDSGWYVVRKTVLRHKIAVVVGTAFVLLLITFAISMSVLYQRAESQRAIAVNALEAEALARSTAEAEAKKANRVREFLADMIQQANPFGLEENLTVLDALNAAALQVEQDAIDEPLVEAGIRDALSVSFIGLGQYETAQQQLEKAIEAFETAPQSDTQQLLHLKQNLVHVLIQQDHLDKAITLAEQTLSQRTDLLGAHHSDTLISAADLARLHRAFGRLEQAETQMEQVLHHQRKQLGDAHSDTLSTIESLARIKKERSKLNAAERLFLEALEGYQTTKGKNHPNAISVMNSIASVYQDQSNMTKAEQYYFNALEMLRQVLDDEHPYLLSAMNNLGNLYRTIEKHPEARALLEETVEKRRRVHGEQHDATLTSLSNLALVLQKQGEIVEAESLFRKVAEIRLEKLGKTHPLTLISYSNLAVFLYKNGQPDAGVAMLAEVLDGRIAALGEGHMKSIATMRALSTYYMELDRMDEAIPMAHRAWQLALTNLGTGQVATYVFQMNYGKMLTRSKRFDEAEDILQEAYDRILALVGPDHRFFRGAKMYLVELLQATGRSEEAQALKSNPPRSTSN